MEQLSLIMKLIKLNALQSIDDRIMDTVFYELVCANLYIETDTVGKLTHCFRMINLRDMDVRKV